MNPATSAATKLYCSRATAALVCPACSLLPKGSLSRVSLLRAVSASFAGLVNNFLKKPLDFVSFMWYIITMKDEKEMNKKTLKPLFDLDGTLIKENRDSDRLFDFFRPHAILALTEDDLTPLGVLVRDSGKEFDILTARGHKNAEFVRIALGALGFNVGRIVTVGIDINEASDMDNVSSKRVAAKKIRIAKFVQRKLVDNDERNLRGLGELGELVSETQTEF